MADRNGTLLGVAGLAIVSGLVRGVDAIAHQGATAVGGRAIGVLGTGIDVCHPKENKKLYEKVLERGAVISEFPIGSHPAPVFGVPGKVTQDVSFSPNLPIEQGAKLVTNAEDVAEGLPTPVRAALVQLEAVESEQRDLLVADRLSPTKKKIYELLRAQESRPIDSLMETSGLNSSEVLATLFTLEMKGIVRQLPGKQSNTVLL